MFLLVPCEYVSIKLNDCILLSSLPLNAILLTYSVNALCFSLLKLCRNFNINLCFINSF